MRSNRRESPEQGLTLIEVVCALLISCVFLMIAMRLLTDQWRGARALKNHLEAQYTVFSTGKTVSDAIRTAESVSWTESGVLNLLPLPDNTNPSPTLNSYFIDDLDRDGKSDLYWRHLGVSQPVGSYVIDWKCTEVEPSLWEIFLHASKEGQAITWKTLIRQRIYSAP